MAVLEKVVRQAERIAVRFYTEGRTKVSYEDVQDRLGISKATWWNYTGILRETGLAVSVPSSSGAEKADLELTEKGREVVRKAAAMASTGAAPVSAASPPLSVPAASPVLTPQALQNLVDEYNKNNPSWPFELVPKGFRKETNGVVAE